QAQRRLAGNSTLDAATRGDLLRTLAEVNLSLSDFTRATGLSDEARVLAAAAGDAAAERAARVLRADALQRPGRNAEATKEVDAVLAALRGAPSPVLLRALAVLAAAEMANGEPDAAIAHRREAATAADAIYGAGSVDALAVAFEVGNTLGEAQHYP